MSHVQRKETVEGPRQTPNEPVHLDRRTLRRKKKTRRRRAEVESDLRGGVWREWRWHREGPREVEPVRDGVLPLPAGHPHQPCAHAGACVEFSPYDSSRETLARK